MKKCIVVVTLAINTGSHAALGTDRKTLYFEEYPTSQDIRDTIEDDVKFKEFFDCCEIDEVADFQQEYAEEDNFISFNCNTDGETIGNVLIEEHPLFSTSAVNI